MMSEEDKKELEEAKKSFKNFYKKGRFQEIKGYKFDKYIFRACSVMSLVFLLVIVLFNGMSFSKSYYYVCPEQAPRGWCENPFYQTVEELPLTFQPFINEEYLPAGLEIGTRPGWFIQNFGWLVLGIFSAGLLINHFKYNKKRGDS